jgi:Domain of unknown function (DUF4157)
MTTKKLLLLFTTSLVLGISLICKNPQPVQAKCQKWDPTCKIKKSIPTINDLKQIDPTNKNSEIRKGGRSIDPTNPQSETRQQLRDLDQQRRELIHLGRQGCIATANKVIDSNGNYRSGNQGLTESEKRYLRPWFGKHIDLDSVEVWWGATLNEEMKIGGTTVWEGSDAQTFGNRIYIKEAHKTGNTKQLILLAHELVHTLQAKRLGSVDNFCEKYMNSWSKALNYEDNIMEREAQNIEFRYAQWLAEKLPKTNYSYTIRHPNSSNYRTVEVSSEFQ